MADGDFLGGLFGGVKDAGSALYGLLGGPTGTPSAGSPTDIMQQLSPEEQRRLTASTLGQIGATLLAAGQKQMPAQRAQILSQLGNVGPNIDAQIQRAVAVRNQQEQLRRQNELFPLQKQQMELAASASRLQQTQMAAQIAMQMAKLQQNIQFLESNGLDASSAREQYRILQQQYGAGTPGGAPAGGAGSPAPTGSSPAVSAGASVAPGATAPSQSSGYTPSPEVQRTPVQEPGFTPGVGPTAEPRMQGLFSRFQYLSPEMVRSAFSQGEDPSKVVFELQKENDKAKQELFKFEGDLRKEYMPRAEKFADMQQTYKSMINLSQEAPGVSDIMLVVQLYKLFDPGSVVSVNETGQVTSASSGVERVQQFIDRFLVGGKLTDEMKQKVLDTARAKFAEGYKDYNLGYNDASKRAAEYGASMSRAAPDVRDPQLKPVMDKIVKLPSSRRVDIGNGEETARLGVDGRYYVTRDSKRLPIEFED